MMPDKHLAYRAYLLRCWPERDTARSDHSQWRFSVEDILHERRRTGFGDLETLIAFLRAEFAESKDEPSE